MTTNGERWAIEHPELGRLLGENAIAPRKAVSAPQPNIRHRARHTPGRMNKTEAAYSRILDDRKAAGEVLAWEFEAIKFRIAEDRCWFTPDFVVCLASGNRECIDVKGGGPIEDDALVKIKVAADKFPMFRFVIEQKTKQGWERREF